MIFKTMHEETNLHFREAGTARNPRKAQCGQTTVHCFGWILVMPAICLVRTELIAIAADSWDNAPIAVRCNPEPAALKSGLDGLDDLSAQR